MKRLVRLGAFYILFGILPILVGGMLARYAIGAWEASERAVALGELRRELYGLQSRFDPINFYAAWFETVCRAGATASEDLRRHRRRAERWGGPVDLFRFDGGASLTEMPWRNPDAPPVMKTLWKELRSGETEHPGRSREVEVSIELLLGTDFRVSFLETAGRRGMLVRPKTSDGLLYWNRDDVGGATIAAVWRMPAPDELLRRAARIRTSPGILLVIDPGEPGQRAMGGECVRETAGDVARGLLIRNDPWIEADGRIWVGGKIGEARILIARPTPAVAADRLRRAADAGGAVLALLLLIFWYRWLLAGRDRWISVRIKLLLLFLFATFVPLAGLAGLASATVTERARVLTDRAWQRGKNLLESLDAGYEADRHRILEVFRRVRDDPGLRSPDPQARHRRVLALRKRFGIVKIELRDTRGELVVSTERPEALARIENVFRVMAQIGLERQAPELIPPDRVEGGRQVDLMTRMAFESPIMGLSAAMDQPDRVHNLDFSIMRGLWYWDIFRDPAHPAAFINMVKAKHEAVKDYLNQYFITRRNADDGYRLFAYNIDGGQLVRRKATPIPQDVQALLDQARVTGRTMMERCRTAGGEYLVVVLPSTFLGRFLLVTAIPLSEALHGLNAFTFALWLMFFSIAIAAIAAGRILADLFLRPVAELAAGMNGLRRGDVSVRVRCGSGDEFGELAHAFNQMVEDLQEVRMAKLIQDSLIPAGNLPLPGFDAAVIMERASELSGDYVDAVELPDRRLLLVTGDVSGQGTSAALAMAMAKCIVIQAADEGGGPGEPPGTGRPHPVPAPQPATADVLHRSQTGSRNGPGRAVLRRRAIARDSPEGWLLGDPAYASPAARCNRAADAVPPSRHQSRPGGLPCHADGRHHPEHNPRW